MQADIQPKYEAMTATCSCGNVVETRSTLAKDITLDICSECHPFYTGKQKLLDSENRVGGFMKKYGSFSQMAKKRKQED